jgi:CobQ-like glutamine amidotransferase family enzyme
MKLKIVWLYGTKMNIYGDRGNVIVLEQRTRWRGIDAEVVEVGIGDSIPTDADVFFFGGGQDQEQVAVSRDLRGEKGKAIAAAVDEGAAMLAVCGGYQLLGHEYRPHASDVLPGIGLFDVVSTAGPERFIGNVVIESRWGEIVGFENHSGVTTLGPGQQPMGKVRIGRGNNGKDGTEGALSKNAVGCYLHGSILPKNPRLADWLIEAGLRRRYSGAELQPLDDRLEMLAHTSAVDRTAKTR